jgi:hypothetical protein
MLTTFWVNSITDNGVGTTLREAIAFAEQSLDAVDMVKFDESVFGTGGTVELTQQIDIAASGTIIIDGTDSNGVPLGITISGGHGTNGIPHNFDGSNLFNIQNPSGNAQVEIDGLKLTGADFAWAVNSTADLTLKNVEISENTGSGIQVAGRNLTVEGSTIADYSGRGISFDAGSQSRQLNLISSTVSGNGISTDKGISVSGNLSSVNIISSTISGQWSADFAVAA